MNAMGHEQPKFTSWLFGRRKNDCQYERINVVAFNPAYGVTSANDDTIDLAPPKTTQKRLGTAAKRAIDAMPHLSPKDASVAAFVVWLQALDMTGDWVQEDLYDEYEWINTLSERDPIALKSFGRELVKAGCRKWQADLRRQDKSRYRPWIITIPDIATVAVALPAIETETFANVRPLAASSRARSRRLPDTGHGYLMMAA